ncbi:CopD family protein [Motiliproteus sp. MSK22-1]|uniref:CopD family protein n=1 Tax=Motiliproteus sp. MSK22-1 TaxID=1897630 RepID=UPI000975720D|nr:CopD family protein [Motiliproteus sp. MSK22-1]OMH32173.1 hypothetical protein BGP75_15870 [Motiliproteus sp. MSK22-1]
MAFALGLHLLAAVIWVGGMLLMLHVVRPVAVSLLEPPQRIPLLSRMLGKFFIQVWGAIAVLLITGFWMIFSVFGGMANVGWHVHLMLGLGLIMILLFLILYFIPYRKLQICVDESRWPDAGAQLGKIRMLVMVNALLGTLIVLAASGGRYL